MAEEEVKFILGKDCVVNCNGTVLKNVRDVTLTLTKGEADVTTRGNQGWRATVGTLKECSAEFETILDESGSGMAAFTSSFISDELLNMSFLANGSGPSGKWSVTNMSREEPLEDAVKYSITVKMAEFGSWT